MVSNSVSAKQSSVGRITFLTQEAYSAADKLVVPPREVFAGMKPSLLHSLTAKPDTTARSSYVGRNDGYKGPVASQPHHGNCTATCTLRHFRDYLGRDDEHRICTWNRHKNESKRPSMLPVSLRGLAENTHKPVYSCVSSGVKIHHALIIFTAAVAMYYIYLLSHNRYPAVLSEARCT